MFLHHLGTFFLFVATILLLFVSVSTPVYNNVCFLKMNVSLRLQAFRATSDDLTLGMWGYCFGDRCSSSSLGYNLNTLDGVDAIDRVEDLINTGSKVLIINVIACITSFGAFVWALGTHMLLGVIASLAASIAVFNTFLALAIDLGIFVTIRNRLNDASDNIDARLGNAIWLVLAALVLRVFAVFTVCWTRNAHKKQTRADNTPVAPVGGGSARAKWLQGMKEKWGTVLVTQNK